MNRDFRLLYASRTVSLLGDTIHAVALLSLVYLKTHSAEAVGNSLFSLMAPRIVSGLVAGAIADRWNRKTIMIASDLYRCVAVASIPFIGSLNALYVLLMTIAGAESLYQIARASALPDVLPEKDAVLRANSLTLATTSVLQIAGPALAGAAVVFAGTTAAFLVDSATFLASALLMLPVRLSATGPAEQRTPLPAYLKQVFDGFFHLFRNNVLTSLALLYTLLAGSVFLVAGLRIVFADRYLKAFGSAPAVYSLMLSLASVGSLLGGLLLPLVTGRVSARALIAFGIAMTSIELFCCAFANSLPLILGASVLSNLCFLMASLSLATLFQAHAERERRGRVLAFFQVMVSFAATVALAAGGLLADARGVRLVFFLAGVLCVALALVGTVLPGLPEAADGGSDETSMRRPAPAG